VEFEENGNNLEDTFIITIIRGAVLVVIEVLVRLWSIHKSWEAAGPKFTCPKYEE